MRIRFLVFFMLVLSTRYSSAVSGNLLDIDWKRGVVVFLDQSVVTGNLSYNSEYQLVLVKVNAKISTYPSRDISSIRFYDKELNINRHFIRIKPEVSSDYQKLKSRLFEVVVQGDIQLLRIAKKYTNNYTLDERYEKDPLNYSYFFLTRNTLYKLSNFKKEFLPVLMHQDKFLTQYLIKENNLNVNNLGHCVQLIVLCNQANATSKSELTAL